VLAGGVKWGLARNLQQLSGEDRFTSHEKKQWALAVCWPLALAVGIACLPTLCEYLPALLWALLRTILRTGLVAVSG
jgi:hypothetical protein